MVRLPSVVIVFVAVVITSSALLAQDAVKLLPENYKITFENDYVRVTRVHYPGKSKLPGHTHTSLPTAYVYLNDSGPVVFRHIGLDYGAVTRPPTVARSYRLFRGLEEIHEVENLSDVTSDFLRVEFKTDPGPEPRTLRGKFLPAQGMQVVAEKVEFENAQLRVSRLNRPSSTTPLAPRPYPVVLISLAAKDLGAAQWVPKGAPLGAAPGAPLEALMFELKTEVKTTR
jgi:hypothetical protein